MKPTSAERVIKFSTEISSSHAFRTFTQNLSLKPRVTFEVICSSKFSGLMVKEVNTDKDVMCKAMFPCRTYVLHSETPARMCIDIKTCTEFLKKVQNNVLLHIVCYEATPDNVEFWYCFGGVEKLVMKSIPVEVRIELPKIKPITTEYMIQANVGVLKRFKKLAQIVGSTKFTFLVKKVSNTIRSQLSDKHCPKIVVVFAFAGPHHSVSRLFPSQIIGSSSTDTNCSTIRSTKINNILAKADLESMQTLHKTVILHEHLTSFIRHMDKETNIEIGLSRNNPVIFNYDLGAPNCFIRNTIAPVTQMVIPVLKLNPDIAVNCIPLDVAPTEQLVPSTIL